MGEHQSIQDFLGRNIDVLSNPDFGSKNFNEIKDRFREIREMIIEMVEIGDNAQIPSGLVNQVYGIANQWSSFHKQVESYNLDADGQSQFRTRQNLINGITQWYDSCMTGYDPQNSNRPNNFLSVYNSIKNFNLKDVETERKKVTALVNELQSNKKTVDTITEEFRRKSGEKTLSDYSVIFNAESERYSCFKCLSPLISCTKSDKQICNTKLGKHDQNKTIIQCGRQVESSAGSRAGGLYGDLPPAQFISQSSGEMEESVFEQRL